MICKKWSWKKRKGFSRSLGPGRVVAVCGHQEARLHPATPQAPCHHLFTTRLAHKLKHLTSCTSRAFIHRFCCKMGDHDAPAAHDLCLPSFQPPHPNATRLPTPSLLPTGTMLATLPLRACLLAGLPLLLQAFLLPAPLRQRASRSATTITHGTCTRRGRIRSGLSFGMGMEVSSSACTHCHISDPFFISHPLIYTQCTTWTGKTSPAL